MIRKSVIFTLQFVPRLAAVSGGGFVPRHDNQDMQFAVFCNRRRPISKTYHTIKKRPRMR